MRTPWAFSLGTPGVLEGPAVQRLCCPFLAEAVSSRSASAPSYRRENAAWSTFTRPSLAGTCPGEVGHDDAAIVVVIRPRLRQSSRVIAATYQTFFSLFHSEVKIVPVRLPSLLNTSPRDTL